MKYMDFIDYGPVPTKKAKPAISILVRQLGIKQFVFVATRNNGGIK